MQNCLHCLRPQRVRTHRLDLHLRLLPALRLILQWAMLLRTQLHQRGVTSKGLKGQRKYKFSNSIFFIYFFPHCLGHVLCVDMSYCFCYTNLTMLITDVYFTTSQLTVAKRLVPLSLPYKWKGTPTLRHTWSKFKSTTYKQFNFFPTIM